MNSIDDEERIFGSILHLKNEKKNMIVLKRLKTFSKITVKYEIIFYLKYILVNINIFFHISFISYHKSFLAQ